MNVQTPQKFTLEEIAERKKKLLSGEMQGYDWWFAHREP